MRHPGERRGLPMVFPWNKFHYEDMKFMKNIKKLRAILRELRVFVMKNFCPRKPNIFAIGSVRSRRSPG
jgi:hypothetical protein